MGEIILQTIGYAVKNTWMQYFLEKYATKIESLRI